ncbi:MAG: zf-HC2 domain-containing protein [Nitrospinae bacterium]|nr:zf-HC2 domain-containing protein [Nitrospinota bacterium]
MVCKECIDTLGDYLDGSLREDLKLELDEHFKDCPPCVAFFNTYKKTTRLCKDALTEVSVPEEVWAGIRSHLFEKIRLQIS